MKFIKIFLPLVIVVGLFLPGCTTTMAERLEREGYSPVYVDGFADGESSGYFAAGNPYYHFVKDTDRFDSDSQYKQGWNDGYDFAKTRYGATERMMRR